MNPLHFIIFSKDDCPNCDKAAWAIDQAGHTYTKQILDKTYTLFGLTQMCLALNVPAPKSVPQIFLGKPGVEGDFPHYIGGLGNLETFLKNC